MEWGVLLEKLLLGVIEGLLPFLLFFLIQWVMRQVDYVKAKLTTEQRQFVETMAMSLVLAAEQVGLKDELLTAGEEKKQWVLTRLEASLKENNIYMDLGALSDAVESAVHKAFKLSAGQ